MRVTAAELGQHRHLTSRGADIVQLQEEIKACSHNQILSELHKRGFKVEVPDPWDEGKPQYFLD